MIRPPKVELLAPAGNFEKLQVAVDYGADAVYLSDQRFSLRNAADNFTVEEIARAAAYTRQNHARLYVACNIYPRTAEEDEIARYLEELGRIGPDAVIVADPGILMMMRDILPDMPIHLSTQANTTSRKAALFWKRQGVTRINIARELSLEEIQEITSGCDLEIEAFVHGSICIAYSGRCLLSNFLAGRDGNRGLCCHPCRSRYFLSEEHRPGQYLPVEETERGTFVFNSRDLCMVDHLDKMIGAGIAALKIEGRMKSIHYLAAVVHTYREALDACCSNPGEFQVKSRWKHTLASLTSRGYSTHFYFGKPGPEAVCNAGINPQPEIVVIAKVLRQTGPGQCLVQVKNKLFSHDPVEILSPRQPIRFDTILQINDTDGAPLDFAQPNTVVTVTLSQNGHPNDLIRRAKPGHGI
ncbi:MAG: U32 family peptidase [Thermodesulfobacteriota bacterium]